MTKTKQSDETTLPNLYDCARLARTLGISRRAAEAIMLRVPKQYIPGLRKVYVRADDVQRLLDANVSDDILATPLRRPST